MKLAGGKVPRHPKDLAVRAEFARTLARVRDQAGLTQAEVGEKAGYEEKYIGLLDRRKHTPTLTAVIEIARALDVSPMEILTSVLELVPSFAYLEKTVSNPP